MLNCIVCTILKYVIIGYLSTVCFVCKCSCKDYVNSAKIIEE